MRSYPWAVAAGVAGALSVAGFAAAAPAPSAPARSASAESAGTAAPAVDLRVGPASAALLHASSRNWAGYAALTGGSTTSFTSLSATWVEPKVTCPEPDAWAVFWVGLDGATDGTVEQGGSSARCVNGVPHYQTWWETFPGNNIQLVNTIRAGDRITATVTYSSGTYTIVVRDDTTGKAFTKKAKCAAGKTCPRSSAEVIAEDVGRGSNQYFPLAKYSPTHFTGTVVKNQAGKAGAFTSGAWRNVGITESGGGTTYADVGPLSDQGRAFTTTWRHQ